MESLRKAEQSLLLLDCGALFDADQDKAEMLVNAMEIMGYDTLNLGGPELSFGPEFLAQARFRVSFPFVASNLFSGGSSVSQTTREYVIKEAGGIRVAILGIVTLEELAQLPDQAQVKDLRVIPPEAALARLLPVVREKADLVILLSRLGAEQTRTLRQALTGIDIAISSGDDDGFFTMESDNTVLQTGALGRRMGLLKISLDGKGVLSVQENKVIPLDQSVPDSEVVGRLIETFKETQVKKAADLEKKKKQELMDRLQMSPQEFMERYRKEQTEKTQR